MLEACAFVRWVVWRCRTIWWCFEPALVVFVGWIVLVVEGVVLIATRSGMSDRPLGDPRPVAMFAVAPSEPDPKRNDNQDESPPIGENGLTLWKALEGSE
jgi:hypothetical protein